MDRGAGELQQPQRQSGTLADTAGQEELAHAIRCSKIQLRMDFIRL
jgi:hypothetical protein